MGFQGIYVYDCVRTAIFLLYFHHKTVTQDIRFVSRYVFNFSILTGYVMEKPLPDVQVVLRFF